MSATTRLKAQKRQIIATYVKPSNLKASWQVLNTLLPMAALWWAIAWSAEVSYWLTAALVGLMCLFLLRVFVLMHECGHGSLFRSAWLNQAVGFVMGVVTGMPQFVWSQNHQYHHSTNGNWARYSGPLAIISVDAYAALSPERQRKYRNARSIWLAPLAGFMYLIVNPRRNCLKGCLAWLAYVVRQRSSAGFVTPYWADAQQARHMIANNLAWLALWVGLGALMGPTLFVVCAVLSVSISGGGGIVMFTVQHNFEHAYASGDEGWDYDQAALEGTSFLVLPRWLNWFTANIAYHHIHHMSARIPNYCLAACHAEHAALFAEVKRVGLADIPAALKCILWDQQQRRITSVAAYEAQPATLATNAA